MKRSRLQNKYLKKLIKKIGNCIPNKEIIASLCKEKTKKNYYEKLDERKLSDSKFFWKTVKPSLPKKLNARKRISLSENCEIVKTEKGTAEVFNNFLIILERI